MGFIYRCLSQVQWPMACFSITMDARRAMRKLWKKRRFYKAHIYIHHIAMTELDIRDGFVRSHFNVLTLFLVRHFFLPWCVLSFVMPAPVALCSAHYCYSIVWVCIAQHHAGHVSTKTHVKRVYSNVFHHQYIGECFFFHSPFIWLCSFQQPRIMCQWTHHGCCRNRSSNESKLKLNAIYV